MDGHNNNLPSGEREKFITFSFNAHATLLAVKRNTEFASRQRTVYMESLLSKRLEGMVNHVG